MGPNIVFWHSKSNFDIQIWAEYRILTFKILFWHSNWGHISYFDIENPTFTFKIWLNIVFWRSKSYLTFKLRPNIVFWHSQSYSKWDQISYFDIQNPILTFKIESFKILFRHSKWPKSYFDIRNGTEYRILTLLILFWLSNWGRISYFDIESPIMTFENWSNPVLSFELRPNTAFWHSESYFDIQNGAEKRI